MKDRMGKSRFLAPAIVLALLALVGAARPARASGDPWYCDLRGHWAYDYIRVLWEEGVTDGCLSHLRDDLCDYFPDHDCSRGQLATLLCKVFGLPPRYPETPTYPDVPTTYRLFWNSYAWPYIEGAFSGGISFVPAGQVFRPGSPISREDAVEFLVRSLDLGPYVASLTPEQVTAALSRFYDYRSVSPVRQKSMACAVQLGIIKGFDDGSLRPQTFLRRAEAAAVVARSCLIRMSARKNVFSPDSDGIDDIAEFDLSYLRNRGIVSWQAAIQDRDGAIVCFLAPPEATGAPPPTIEWRGQDYRGWQTPAGRYYYQALVTDRAGRQFYSIRQPLDLVRHTLTAYLEPSNCRDGWTLTISASTNPGAQAVTASLADGSTRHLGTVDQNTSWRYNLVMGPFLPPGDQTTLVRAYFGQATREVHLSFRRTEEVWLLPSLHPNPATWGQTVELLCLASSGVIAVEAQVMGSRLDLVRTAETGWRSELTVPWGIPPGFYPVLFTARTAGSVAEVTIGLEVGRPDTAGLMYVLSK